MKKKRKKKGGLHRLMHCLILHDKIIRQWFIDDLCKSPKFKAQTEEGNPEDKPEAERLQCSEERQEYRGPRY